MSRAENEEVSRATGEVVRRLDTLPIPTVALVQGGCFGGGTGIVAACDVVVAAADAVFAITETRWGLMPGIILPQLHQAIGLRALRRYALTGERFGAHEAHRIGLVHEVCPVTELEEGRREGFDKDEEIDRQVTDLRKRLVVQRVMRKYQTPPEVTELVLRCPQ